MIYANVTILRKFGDDFLRMVMYSLYGTYLVFQVEKALHGQEEPVTARDIALELADLDEDAQRNLTRRVRNALNLLAREGKAAKLQKTHRNLIVFQYTIHPHEHSDH